MLIRLRIARVVHAGVEIRVVEVFVLMIKAEGMANFLAGHEVAPRRRVIRCALKVTVVELRRALGDVDGVSDPDLGDAEPTVEAVWRDAHFNAAGLRTAVAI